MMSKDNTEELFLEYWKENTDIEIIPQFQPSKVLYEALDNPELKYREWCKDKGIGEYRMDFLVGGLLSVEFDGSGKHSHIGAGAERDRQKQNIMLKLGYPTARFSITTVKNSFSYVLDEILDIYESIR